MFQTRTTRKLRKLEAERIQHRADDRRSALARQLLDEGEGNLLDLISTEERKEIDLMVSLIQNKRLTLLEGYPTYYKDSLIVVYIFSLPRGLGLGWARDQLRPILRKFDFSYKHAVDYFHRRYHVDQQLLTPYQRRYGSMEVRIACVRHEEP